MMPKAPMGGVPDMRSLPEFAIIARLSCCTLQAYRERPARRSGERPSHSNLNGLRADDCLWSNHVAHYVSIRCCRPAAAARPRSGGVRQETAQAGLAWLRLPA